MHDFDFLLEILIFLIAAVCIVPIAKWLRSSGVLGYLAAGLLVGPHALGLIEDVEKVQALAELGVVFLLFTIGLELSLERLKLLRHLVFGLGTLQVVLTALAIGVVLIAIEVPAPATIVIAGSLAFSSTAFVLQLLVERGELATRFGRVTFSVLLLQDLAVVPMLALVPLLATSGVALWAALGLAALKATVTVAIMLLLGRLVLRPLFRVVAGARSPELFVATTLLVVLGAGYAMIQAGVSMALGAFLAGLLLSGTEYRHQVEADIGPFRGLLLGLFFMFVGMSIDLSVVVERWPVVVAGMIALMLAKSAILSILCALFRLPADVALRVGLYLSQAGEFGLVLVGLGMSIGIIAPMTGAIAMTVAVLTMAATPFAVYVAGRIAAGIVQRQGPVVPVLEELQDSVGELSGHVVIAGFGRVGQTVARLLSAQGIAYVAVDSNVRHVTRCRRHDLTVHYGDAGRLDVLEAAGCGRAAAAVITLDDAAIATRLVAAMRQHFPKLPIHVRARDRHHAELLQARGATEAVPETVEASLQLGSVVLAALGTRRDDVDQLLSTFRAEKYAALQGIVDAKAEQDA